MQKNCLLALSGFWAVVLSIFPVRIVIVGVISRPIVVICTVRVLLNLLRTGATPPGGFAKWVCNKASVTL